MNDIVTLKDENELRTKTRLRLVRILENVSHMGGKEAVVSYIAFSVPSCTAYLELPPSLLAPENATYFPERAVVEGVNL